MRSSFALIFWILITPLNAFGGEGALTLGIVDISMDQSEKTKTPYKSLVRSLNQWGAKVGNEDATSGIIDGFFLTEIQLGKSITSDRGTVEWSRKEIEDWFEKPKSDVSADFRTKKWKSGFQALAIIRTDAKAGWIEIGLMIENGEEVLRLRRRLSQSNQIYKVDRLAQFILSIAAQYFQI